MSSSEMHLKRFNLNVSKSQRPNQRRNFNAYPQALFREFTVFIILHAESVIQREQCYVFGRQDVMPLCCAQQMITVASKCICVMFVDTVIKTSSEFEDSVYEKSVSDHLITHVLRFGYKKMKQEQCYQQVS